jgi:hypothetical protein
VPHVPSTSTIGAIVGGFYIPGYDALYIVGNKQTFRVNPFLPSSGLKEKKSARSERSGW